MDLKIILTTFSAVFIAELADKTQIVGIGMASKTGKPFTVWVGSVLGYMLVTAISVLLGSIIARHIGPEIIKYTGAGIFILIGVLIFAGKI